MGGTTKHIWPVGGGKGGSGKTFICSSLAMHIASRGFRVVAVDLDLGAANLHTMMGIRSPARGLSDFINRQVSSLAEVVMETPFAGLDLISGAMSSLDIANLAHEQKNRLVRHIAGLDYPYLFLDLGAGTSYNTLDFFMMSNHGIFVATPEPTAIENIYRVIRSVYFRKIRHILKSHHFRQLAEAARERDARATVSNPEILLATAKDLDPAQGELLAQALESFHFYLVINQHRKHDNPHIGPLVCKIIRKHLGLKMDFLGAVSFDDRVHNAVCRMEPFLRTYPYTQAALDLKNCADNLLAAMESRVCKAEAIV